jgi:hypothetical protein
MTVQELMRVLVYFPDNGQEVTVFVNGAPIQDPPYPQRRRQAVNRPERCRFGPQLQPLVEGGQGGAL